jgi:hypothetical protein
VGDDDLSGLKEQIESLEIDLSTAGSLVDVSVLTDEALLLRYEGVKEELMERQEAMHPHTQTGRDLHSLRVALLVAMARRGLR